MAQTISLEGSDEDLGKLLLAQQIVTAEQLEEARREQLASAVIGIKPASLRDVLLKKGYISSTLLLEILRVTSKVIKACSLCGTVHQIYFAASGSTFDCGRCRAPMRIVEADHAGVAASEALAGWIQPPASPAPAPPVTPPAAADASVTLAPLPDADDTLLDLGLWRHGTVLQQGRTGAARPQTPTPKPAAPTPPSKAGQPPQSPAPPAPPPTPRAEKLPDLYESLAPLPEADDTLLEIGFWRQGSTPSPGEAPKARGGDTAGPSQSPGEAAVRRADPPGGTAPPVKTSESAAKGDAGSAPALAPPKADETSVTVRAGPVSKPPAPAAAGSSAGSHKDTTKIMKPDAGGPPAPGPSPSGPETIVLRSEPPGAAAPPPKASESSTVTVRASTARGRAPLPEGSPFALPREGDTGPTVIVTPPATSDTGPTVIVTPPHASDTSATVRAVRPAQDLTPSATPSPGRGIPGQRSLPPEVAEAARNAARVFGKYVLMKELGRGGAGVVFKAWDTLLQQYVALKFIRDQETGGSETPTGSAQVDEFQHEARLSVKLRHPNIVRIYELGCMSNRYYLSMEYIEGGNLLEAIHGGRERNTNTTFGSDPDRFLKILKNISMAVDYAHTLKPPVVHRDLKPHNVLVDKSGNPFVVDFGLAKEVEVSDNQTVTGVVKGTPTYMAPEQAEGHNREVDARTDVYSLGAILYEMIAGRPPFLGESVPEILRKIVTELPERPNAAILRLLPDPKPNPNRPVPVPKPLETICLKALEKSKADRYQSAREFAEDLERYMNDEDILATEPGLYRRIRRKLREHPVITATAATLLFAVGAFGIAGRALRRPDGDVASVKLQVVGDIVGRGSRALHDRNWVALNAALEDLRRQSPGDAHIAEFEKALKEHDELIARTRREWKGDLERISREPLKGILPGLREKFRACPELHSELRDSLREALDALQSRLLADARRILGSGTKRPAWVEEIIKQPARETRDQISALVGLAKDDDFPIPASEPVEEAGQGLDAVIAYQGTWSLQVNVAPFAEVAVLRSDKELTTDFTPIGLQELEVVGASYTIDLYWPSRKEAKVKMTEQVKDLRHGQTVVIRGDITKAALKQERK